MAYIYYFIYASYVHSFYNASAMESESKPIFPSKGGGRYEYSSEFGANGPLIQKVKAVNLILEKYEPPIYLMESIEIEGLGVKNRRPEFSSQVGMGVMPKILEIEERDSLIKISWMLNSQKKLYYLKTGSIQ